MKADHVTGAWFRQYQIVDGTARGAMQRLARRRQVSAASFGLTAKLYVVFADNPAALHVVAPVVEARYIPSL